MKYCVIKDTVRVIDGSDNPLEIMLENAQNVGFTENEVEILTEAEYQIRLENEPKPPQEPTFEERMSALEMLELERMFAI